VSGRGPSRILNLILGNPGRCPDEHTLLICIFDDSGSMLGGSDSTGLRYAEAAIVFDKTMRKCRCDRELVAILHMNRPTSADLAPSPLNKRAKTRIADALTVPRDGDGASTLGATLHRAEQLALAHSHHKTTLACFSDYELTDDATTMTRSMAAFPGDVHAVVMRSTPPVELASEDSITVTQVANGEAPGAVARALFEAITLHRPVCRSAVPTVPKEH
jgi:hypothetical protein